MTLITDVPVTDLVTNPAEIKKAQLGRRRERRTAEAITADMRYLCQQLNDTLAAGYGERPSINSPAALADIIRPLMTGLANEELWVALLNTRNRLIKLVRLYSGSLNTSLIRMAEVFREAIVENAAGIIVCHNHPTGDPSPSAEDVAVTRAMWETGKLLEIELMDHLIIGGSRFVSLKERGLGFG